MSSRLIEECFELENVYEEEYCYIEVSKGTTLIIFDPYMINSEDLRNVRPGVANLIRIRRPGWGRGNVTDYICKLEVNN